MADLRRVQVAGRRQKAVGVGFLFLVIAGPLALLAAPQQPLMPKVTADPSLEFPPYEGMLISSMRAAQEREQSAQAVAKQPAAAQAISSLVSRDQLADAIAAARQIVEQHPERTSEAVSALSRNFMAWRSDTAQQVRPAARAFIEVARKQISALPREQAAEAAYKLLAFENLVELRFGRSYYETFRPFVAEYAGTEAAELAEVALYVEQVRSVAYAGRLEPFETFARTRKSPCARARALQEYASYQSWGDGRGQAEDPTERFLRVFEIVPLLENPDFAACDPKPNAVAIVSGMSMYNARFAPANAERLIASFTKFALAHFTLDSGDADNAVGYILASKVPDLYRAKGASLADIERYLAEIETQVPFPDTAAYLRASFNIREARRQAGTNAQPATPNDALLDNAQQTLSALAARGTDLYNRKALATLGWLYYYRGELAKAREAYAKYASAYPQSPYAWVAATRAGQCAEGQGDWKAAAGSYRLVATEHSTDAYAAVLGHAYAARAFEALGDFERAKVEYRAAVDVWDPIRLTYTMDLVRRPAATSIADPATLRNPYEVTNQDLTSRLAQLTRTTSAPGGAAIEQARWLVDHGRRKEAVQQLADFAKRYPRSANVPEAQYLVHKARLYDALELLNIEGVTNEAAGLAALDALLKEPYDFPVFAAKVTKASVLWKQGRAGEAEALLGDALKDRVARQKPQEPASPLEKDLAEIRRLLMKPAGGEPYGTQGWNAFSWPSAPPPFVVFDADTNVESAEHRTTRVTLYHSFPGLSNVLLVNREELQFFADLMNKVGGTKRRDVEVDVQKAVQTGVMETPNQPIGPSLQLMTLFNKFFPARPGHWGGWGFLTYPDVSLVEFTDRERTKALAHVTIGYSGCVLLLEKVNGTWKAVRMTSTWVT